MTEWNHDISAAPRGKMVPEDIRKTAAKTVFDLESRIQAGEFYEPQSIKFSQTLVATFENVILAERKAAETREDAMYVTGVSDAEAWARKWGYPDFAERLVKEVNARADKSGLSKMRASA